MARWFKLLPRIFRVFLFAWLVLPAAARAEPALWSVKSEHATVYLFGTVHVLKAGVQWQSPKIMDAFAKSDELWVELVDDKSAMLALSALGNGLDLWHPLSSKLSKAEVRRVDAAAKAAGIDGGIRGLERMRPWLAALMISMKPMMAAGFDPKYGVEQVLEAEAAKTKKPVVGLETAQQQLHFLADLPQPVEVKLLLSTTNPEMRDVPGKIDELIRHWMAGDAASLAELAFSSDQGWDEALDSALIAKRNSAWAERVAQHLGGAGVVFLAVGAGHLAGPESLQHELETRGFKVERE